MSTNSSTPFLLIVSRQSDMQKPEALQVALPPDQLTGVIMSSPASEVTIQSGFTSQNFGISSPFSSGNVYALGLDAANLSIANSG